MVTISIDAFLALKGRAEILYKKKSSKNDVAHYFNYYTRVPNEGKGTTAKIQIVLEKGEDYSIAIIAR